VQVVHRGTEPALHRPPQPAGTAPPTPWSGGASARSMDVSPGRMAQRSGGGNGLELLPPHHQHPPGFAHV